MIHMNATLAVDGATRTQANVHAHMHAWRTTSDKANRFKVIRLHKVRFIFANWADHRCRRVHGWHGCGKHILCRNAWIFSRIVPNNGEHGRWSMWKIHCHPCVRADLRFTRAPKRYIGLCDYSKDMPRTVKIWLKHGPSLTCSPIQCFG